MKGSRLNQLVAVAASLVLLGVVAPVVARATSGPSSPYAGSLPRAQCGPGSDPESGLQGRVSAQDVSQVQRRVANPQVRTVSHLTWDTVSIPQVPIPVTINQHPYLIEIDEFATAGGPLPSSAPSALVGAARIIDIADPAHPQVISNIRLEVNVAQNRAVVAGDPGANSSLQGYAGHYCGVPQRVVPGIVACSFILFGPSSSGRR